MSLSHGLTEETMEKLREEYAKMQLQQALAAQQAQQTYASQNATLAQQAHAWGQGRGYKAPTLEEAPPTKLDEGAWDVPISQLVDLWIVRYGTKWVNSDELDDFYAVAARRLRGLNKLETHYVNSTDVYRIVE
jgi:hypothetical protein